jgi:hypothetical protein
MFPFRSSQSGISAAGKIITKQQVRSQQLYALDRYKRAQKQKGGTAH